MKREYLFYGLGYLVFVAIFMLPLGMAFKRELDEKQTAKVLAEQQRAESEREKLASEAIKAMMQEYPQRSETMAENEIPKIVRGTTGQAKLVDHSCPGGYLHAPDWWRVSTSGRPVVAENDPSGLDYVGDPGWWVTSDGMVTVPENATPGLYTGDYSIGKGICDPEDDAWETYFYEFEVVCFKVTITAAPSGGSGSGSGSGG